MTAGAFPERLGKLAGAQNGWLIKKQNEGQNGKAYYYAREGAAIAGHPEYAPRLILVYHGQPLAKKAGEANKVLLPTALTLQRLNIGSDHFLRFGLPQAEHVTVNLFDMHGRMVAQLMNQSHEAGYYAVPLPTGLNGSYYLLDFRAGKLHETLRISP